ncbi:MFS transporter [Streptomyces inusitatus]|uniref:MFS transporter n=1 Tax=Streptomyces inusitatus TaxID=68221 RepID=UPI00167F0B1A|nr:MFS transporter [Streptomyces inusitatus]
MANPYGALFRAPGSVAFSLAGYIARLPMAMAGIGIITMLSETRGEYGLAGAVAAAFTLSTALLGPQISRLVDRFGQGRTLIPAMGVSVLSMGALLLCVRHGAPAWALFACAVPAGALPNMAAMVRARWAHLYRDDPRLHSALSFESVVDELTFVVGPAVAVTLCTAFFPEAGPLAATALLALGVLLFVPQKRTEPPVLPPTGGSGGGSGGGGSAIRIGALRLLTLTLVAGGVIVGTVDVAGVAFAKEQNMAAGAGVVISAYAIGSAASGLVFGALELKTPLPRLLLLGAVGTALTTLPFLLADSVRSLAAAVFLAGLFFSPTMISIMGLVERTVPAAKLTEGMTWVITGLSVGVALGAAVSGAMIDAYGPTGGFLVAVAAGVALVLLALVGQRPLLARTGRAKSPGAPGGAEIAGAAGAAGAEPVGRAGAL